MLYATMRIGNNCEYFLFQSTIYCTPTTPPTGLDNYTFETTCKIYVPLSAVSSYKYRESWSKYASQIEGYDFE